MSAEAVVLKLENKRFQNLEQAEEYVNQFDIKDQVVACGSMHYSGGMLQVGSKEFPFAENSWGSFLREVIPGASRFLNSEDCPPDLAEQIINRMLKENKDMKRMIRIEQKNDGGLPYVKAFLSDNYKPYNNQQFIQIIKESVAGKDDLKVLRPSICGGDFSVNVLNLNQQIDIVDKGNQRMINVGINYRNGEDGGASVSRLPFTFDRFCENGTVFGKKFLDAVSKRVVHRGDAMPDRVLALMGKADQSAVKVLQMSFVNMMNMAMTSLYFKHVAERAIYPNKIIPQKEFEAAIPFDAEESRFGFYNRINEFAHVGAHSENKRLELERLAGMVVEENILV